jgi:hypothetical protein
VYPGGFYNPEALNIVEQSGHSYGFGTSLGISDLSKSRFELRRINMLPGTTSEKLENTIKELESTQQENMSLLVSN